MEEEFSRYLNIIVAIEDNNIESVKKLLSDGTNPFDNNYRHIKTNGDSAYEVANLLGRNEIIDIFDEFKECEEIHGFPNKEITSISLIEKDTFVNNCIRIAFKDEEKCYFIVMGHQCCENLFFNSDDDLNSLNGQVLNKIVIKNCIYNINNNNTESLLEDQLDCVFLEISTQKNNIIVKAYNGHNGFYSGFIMHHFYGKQEEFINKCY